MPLEAQFSQWISRLINRLDLTADESRAAFSAILTAHSDAAAGPGPSPLEQGAFLAALRAKGETEAEVVGAWQAIFSGDTACVALPPDLAVVENTGTGMDEFKTFNISTAAAVVAAALGVPMARHGARAITSTCGTVDMAEALGVDVDADVSLVARSIATVGMGLFNGTSPAVHPALCRILPQLHFGTTLNIAASLANPAMPRLGVRGVSRPEMIRPVIRVMKAIRYQRAIVCYGAIDGMDKGMDEASVCGATHGAELFENGDIREFSLKPADLGFSAFLPDDLAPEPDREQAARRFVALIRGKADPRGVRCQTVALNTALILKVAGKADRIPDGMAMARHAIETGKAYMTLENWVAAQNRRPEQGLATLRQLWT